MIGVYQEHGDMTTLRHAIETRDRLAPRDSGTARAPLGVRR